MFSSPKNNPYYSIEVKRKAWNCNKQNGNRFIALSWRNTHQIFSMEVSKRAKKEKCVLTTSRFWKCFDGLSLICCHEDCGSSQSNSFWRRSNTYAWFCPCYSLAAFTTWFGVNAALDGSARISCGSTLLGQVQSNNLTLNTKKTKESITDFRRNRDDQQPLEITQLSDSWAPTSLKT